jgi:hypothetical protein
MHFCVLRDAMMFGLHRRHFSHWAKTNCRRRSGTRCGGDV